MFDGVTVAAKDLFDQRLPDAPEDGTQRHMLTLIDAPNWGRILAGWLK